VPVHGLLRIRLLALPPDAQQVSKQATTKALDHRGRLGQLALALVEKCASVEIGSLAYELRVAGGGLGTSEQALQGPDVDPAAPAVQAQPPLLPEDGLLTTQEAAQPVQRARRRHASRVAFPVGPERIHQQLLAHATPPERDQRFQQRQRLALDLAGEPDRLPPPPPPPTRPRAGEV